MTSKKIAIVVPTYLYRFDYAARFKESWELTFSKESDLFFIFSNEFEAKDFGHKNYIVLPKEMRQTSAIAVVKKFYGLYFMHCNYPEYKYIIIPDDDSAFINPGNNTLLGICDKIYSEKILFGNDIGNRSLFKRIIGRCASYFSHAPTDLYLWFNNLPVYYNNYLDDFFETVKIIGNWGNLRWEDFEHLIYMYYLIEKRAFIVCDLGVTGGAGFSESFSTAKVTQKLNVCSFPQILSLDISEIVLLLHQDREYLKIIKKQISSETVCEVSARVPSLDTTIEKVLISNNSEQEALFNKCGRTNRITLCMLSRSNPALMPDLDYEQAMNYLISEGAEYLRDILSSHYRSVKKPLDCVKNLLMPRISAEDPNAFIEMGRAYRDLPVLGMGETYLKSSIEYLEKANESKLTGANNELFDALWKLGTDDALREAVHVAEDGAKSGDKNAMFRLSKAFREGQGVEKDLNEAANWLRKAVDAGLFSVNNDLYDVLKMINTKESCAEAFERILKYSETGDSLALLRVGRSYRDGKGVEKNLSLAEEYFHKAVTQMESVKHSGLEWVYPEYANILLAIGSPESLIARVELLTKASDLGYMSCYLPLARSYRDGKGVDVNLSFSVKYYRKAVLANQVGAWNELFDILWKIGTKESYHEMITVIRPYADSNDALALLRVGRSYRDGKGVEKNLSLAEEYFHKAVTQMESVKHSGLEWVYPEYANILLAIGSPESLIARVELLTKASDLGYKSCYLPLARSYRDGKGVDVNLNLATKHFKSAVSAHCQGSWNELFDVLWTIGTPESYKDMIELIQPYADIGDGYSILRLGRAYRDGRGVKKNLYVSSNYFKLSISILERNSDPSLKWIYQEYCKLLSLIADEDSYLLRNQILQKMTNLGVPSAPKQLAMIYGYDVSSEHADVKKAWAYLNQSNSGASCNMSTRLHISEGTVTPEMLDSCLRNVDVTKKLWVLICGAIRNEFEIVVLLTRLTELHRDGRLLGVSISTWVGEVDKIPGLREKLCNFGVNIIELPNVKSDSGEGMSPSYFRQVLQVYQGLLSIPSNCLVIKCRTDFSLSHLNLALRFDFSSLNITKRNAFNDFLSHKIMVRGISVNVPFEAMDLVFCGYRDDLLTMCSFESYDLSIGDKLMPDCLFFLNPFLHRYKYLLKFFKMVNYWSIHVVQTGSISDMPLALVKFYAFYFSLCSSCFVTLITDVFTHSFEKIFVPTKTWKRISSNQIQEILNATSELPLDTSFQYLSKKISQNPYDVDFTQSDLDELDLWSKIKSVGSTIKPRLKISKDISGDVQYSIPASIIKLSLSTNFYSDLLQSLQIIKMETPEIYESALVSSARRFETAQDVMDLLYNNKLSSINYNLALRSTYMHVKRILEQKETLSDEQFVYLVRYCCCDPSLIDSVLGKINACVPNEFNIVDLNDLKHYFECADPNSPFISTKSKVSRIWTLDQYSF